MNRKQRRAMEKKNRKQQKTVTNSSLKNTSASSAPVDQLNKAIEQLNKVTTDIKTIYNYAKSLDTKLTLLTETLIRKEDLSQQDIRETQSLYSIKDVKKQERIKELLGVDLTLEELFSEVREDPDQPGYEKLGIDLVKDLNVNPYELAQFIKDKNPGVPFEEVLKYSGQFGLVEKHFGVSSKQNDSGQ